MNVDTKGPRKHKDEGGIEKHRAQIVSGGRRDVPAWWGEGGVGSTVPEQRRDPGPARVRSPRVGLRRGPGEGRVWSARPSPVLARNPTRWASRKESDQGVGPKATSLRCSSRRGCSREQDPARQTRGLCYLSPDPSALTPPHDALQPPLRHRRRHLPQAVEPQPPPATRNLLGP